MAANKKYCYVGVLVPPDMRADLDNEVSAGKYLTISDLIRSLIREKFVRESVLKVSA